MKTHLLTRAPLIALAALTLLAAMWAGLVRLGWAFPPLRPNWVANHGPLMISGFLASGSLYLAGAALAMLVFETGVRLSGVGLIALGLWLLRYDLARKTIRQAGLPRFIAACLLPGYVWLIVAGVLWAWRADAFAGGPLYDAMLHSLLLGFVFSMIFGHAPVILPAVMNVAMAYRRAFFAHLALLHAGLILRVAGDLAFNPALRMWGGMLNVIAILVFLGNTVRSALIRE